MSAAVPVPWQDFGARAFGRRLEDLALDFRAPPPVQASAVLAHCVAANDDVWGWDLARRLQALLAVTVATRGARYVVTAHCNAGDCGEPMDLPLDLRDFAAPAASPAIECRPADGPLLTLRLPRGDDQRRWLAGIDDPSAGAPVMAADLVERVDGVPTPAGWQPEPGWLADIEQALEQADPLTALVLETACPSCGEAVRVALDLESHLLALLAGEQPRLLEEIHRLASAYHWSEADIVALPATRRRAYLDRLDRDGLA